MKIKNKKALQRMAKLMAVHCYRNTVIENYHAQGKLDDAEMCALNKEVCNKIYTFMALMENDYEAFNALFGSWYGMGMIDGWDDPVLDKDMVKGAKIFLKERNWQL